VDVEVGTVDRRRHPCGPGGDHHAGATVQELGRIARQIDADVDREVPEPKHERHDALGGRERELLAAHEPEGGLDERQEADLSLGNLPFLLESADEAIDRAQRLDVLDLWNHDAVELGADHGLDVSFHQTRVNTVDPHDDGDVLEVGGEGGAC